MSKAAGKKPAGRKEAYRFRICFLWKLFEVEGEGALPAARALLFGLLLLAWLALR